MRSVRTAARASPLSRAQAVEVQALLPHLELSMHFVETIGDLDKKTSLRDLGKSDFFTREIDRMLLEGKVDAAIHSAKDLPEPLPDGLSIAALTAGVDPRDALVLRRGQNLSDLPEGSCIATSSKRREDAVKTLRSGFCFCDLRGTIQERLEKLERGEVDGVVVAEAALARLGLRAKLNRFFLPGDAAESQGRLAIVVRSEDTQTKELFCPIDARRGGRIWTVLHLGLDPESSSSRGRVYHYPVIGIKPLAEGQEELFRIWPFCTHVLVTSKETAALLPSLEGKTVIAIGEKTALAIKGAKPLVAPFAEQEGMIRLLETLDLSQARVCYPRSGRARPLLADYLREKKVSSHVIDLYETMFQQPGAAPKLDEIDEIVFTSPSCAEGFRRIFGPVLPKGKKITLQGRITAAEKLFATSETEAL